MIITEQQYAEIRAYINPASKFRETNNEIYDHILNALRDEDGTFSMKVVEGIVERDLGGFGQIIEEEKAYQKAVSRKYLRLLWSEVKETFRFPAAIGNLTVLLLCMVLHFASLKDGINMKPLSLSVYLIWMLPGAFYCFKRFIADRKQIKPSIKYDFLHITWQSGYLMLTCFFCFLLSETNIFQLSPTTKNDLVLLLFLISSVYIRAYYQLFTGKIMVLAV